MVQQFRSLDDFECQLCWHWKALVPRRLWKADGRGGKLDLRRKNDRAVSSGQHGGMVGCQTLRSFRLWTVIVRLVVALVDIEWTCFRRTWRIL